MRPFEYDEVHKQITLLKINNGTGPDGIYQMKCVALLEIT